VFAASTAALSIHLQQSISPTLSTTTADILSLLLADVIAQQSVARDEASIHPRLGFGWCAEED
jgi:hypothetical protein